jgi:predicted branched-subunit amino acid permease
MTTAIAQPPPSVPTGLSPRLLALRDLRTIAPGVVPFGVMLGVTVTGSGMGWPAGVVGAVLVYGGSAQLTTVTLLGMGARVVAAVASGAVVNLRVLLYGAALAPAFRGQPRWFRLLGPLFIIDQTYVSALGHPEVSGAVFRRYWSWLGSLLLVVWTSAVAAGLLFAPVLPGLPHLGLVAMALFLAMLAPRLVDRPAVVAAAAGGAVALGTAPVAPQLAGIAGALAGVTAGLLVERAVR